ncbi:MAG: hypothetical protein AB9891_19590 [Anaerolineaceae bacterium]
MTKKFKVNIIICFCFFICGGVAVSILNLQLQEKENASKLITSNIKKQITENQDNENPIINVAKATYFSWDTLHIIQPYTTAEGINKQLGFIWLGAYTSRISVSDNYYLLVFVRDKWVVQNVEIPIEFAQGSTNVTKNSYSYKNACFRIITKGKVIIS